MVCNLMKVGYEIATCTNTRSRMEDIIGEEAIWCGNAGEHAKGRQAVVSIMGYSEDVRDICFGEGGIIVNIDPGTYLIDMTTTGPRLAVRTYEEAKKTGPHALDTSVIGGGKRIKDGALTILADGDRGDSDVCLSILQAMDKNIDYEGKARNGQHTKMYNQIAVAGALAGACEAMVYAKNVGLDMDTMLRPISTGVASSVQMNNVALRALQDDYRSGFFIKRFIRDMSLADEGARAVDVKLKVLEDVPPMHKELEQEGMEELGTQALIKYYDW